jgi:urease accessory protein
MTALLDITLAADRANRTRIAHLIQHFPQHITAPMYIDGDDPSRAHLCIQNPSAGIFPGDKLHTRVTAGSGTRVCITTQSATQVFAPHRDSESEGASSNFEFIVDDGAVVEHFPKTTIPHRNSTLRQVSRVSVSGDGIFSGWNALAAGRIGHGEHMVYRGYDTRTVIDRDGKTVARDRMVLRPAQQALSGPGIFHGRSYLGTLILIAPSRIVDEVLTVVRQTVDPELLCGTSTLPHGIGLTIRLLADSAPQLAVTQQVLWAAIRTSLTGCARQGRDLPPGM